MTEQNKPLILVVDDIPGNIKTIAAVLNQQYEVIFATNGVKALELANSRDVDLVLLDIIMPEMDGFEVCQQLKSEEKTRDIPVIFVTAKNEEGDETHGFELGAVDYITKPISPSIVQARVATQIEISHSRRVLQEKHEELLKMSRLKEDVEHIIRHDLKSPINGLIGFCEMLSNEEGLSVDHRQSVEIMKDLAYRAIDMINLSLGMVKMEHGTYDLKPEPLDIIPMIFGIFSDLGSNIKFKGLTISLILNGETITKETKDQYQCLISGEQLLSYSLFANLIKNAVEASPRKESLTIKIDQQEQIQVAIHNMGTVPQAIRKNFFDKYVTAGKSSGTGLGTYSARLITETQHGSIAMQTSEDEGTTITVILPASD